MGIEKPDVCLIVHIQLPSIAYLYWLRFGGFTTMMRPGPEPCTNAPLHLRQPYVPWEPPDVSGLGIAVAALSLLVMPWLARQKRLVATSIGSRALEADSRQTSLCAYLSAILLGGLVLNALFGWWWADPAAALLMVPIIGSEGFDALRGERCEERC